MSRLLARLTKPCPRRNRTAPRTRVELERLETREVLSGISLYNGTLSISSSDKGDTVTISTVNTSNSNPYAGQLKVNWTRGDNQYEPTRYFDLYKTLPAGAHQKAVTHIRFDGGAGADKVWNNTAISSELYGYAGNDELHGGSGKDVIYGGRGSDTLTGGDGNDELWAFSPNQFSPDGAADKLDGGAGDDFLFGADGGVNLLTGGANDDALYGGDGSASNFLYGGAGNDKMYGGDGAKNGPTPVNTMIDGQGSDLFWGGDHAYNFMNAVDGVVGPNSDDDVILGTDSNNVWSVDPTVTVYYTQGDRVYKSSLTYELGQPM
jgi:VCBS repeat-containing protein